MLGLQVVVWLDLSSVAVPKRFYMLVRDLAVLQPHPKVIHVWLGIISPIVPVYVYIHIYMYV